MTSDALIPDLTGHRVLVTGGTGFIGGRLVERLALESGADTRVLVRNWGAAARVARLRIEMVQGDVTDRKQVENAMRGCDIVFHCAYGTSGFPRWQELVNVQGTRNVLAAARRLGVKRVVYLSTVLVYGLVPGGDLDEKTPKGNFGGSYARSKLKAERIAANYIRKHKLPVAILQPTAVYGPFGGVWTTTVLNRLKTGKVILVNGGDGVCNAVYVDDLVNAMLLAATRVEAVGQEFLISGGETLTWRDYFGAFAEMLGTGPRTVNMTASEARKHYHENGRPKTLVREAMNVLREDQELQKRLIRTREAGFVIDALPARLGNAAKALVRSYTSSGISAPVASDEGLVHPTDPKMISFFETKSRVRIDKAERLLGYHPRFGFDEGVRATAQWARWANVIPAALN